MTAAADGSGTATLERAPEMTQAPVKKTQIIAIYGKRDRQEFHARQPVVHDGATGQARAAHRLRSEERHHFAAVRRQGLPDDHRDILEEEGWPARKSPIGDVCFKRDGVYAMDLGGPEVGRGCGGRGIIHGFETLEKLVLPRLGFRLRAARLPG